ncbi:hypothetical protein LTR56_017206 [Elasticomyces elasticus]|nr:hypothetical protein LTR56_017206 [Elasticomyces elasticus]KAK3666322.1 hypothetical protein LTR22_002986 [Elasticomyces elasticus]KAK4926918.1 hypothetical protein LTR49_006334 [Elasticomyces elasticus]KAK5752652.1 hypothetical protein LTS12_017221 [Elasticomyces elasticus]
MGVPREGISSGVQLPFERAGRSRQRVPDEAPNYVGNWARACRVSDVGSSSSRSISEGDEYLRSHFPQYVRLDSTSSGSLRPGSSDAANVEEPEIVAIPTPQGYRKLTYLPFILWPMVTLVMAILWFSIMGGMIAVALLADSRTAYPVKTIHAYSAAHYGPALTAIGTTLVFKSMLDQLRRIMPYINLADRHRGRSITSGTYSIGDAGWPLIMSPVPKSIFKLFVMVMDFFTTTLVSYKTLLLHIAEQDGIWLLSINTLVAWVLASFYGVIGITTLGLTIWLWKRETGLREGWDPRTLADIIALFYRFDWHDRDLKIVDTSLLARRLHLRHTVFRLGYWRHVENDVLYGIRVVNKEDAPNCICDQDPSLNSDYPKALSFLNYKRPKTDVYRHAPLLARSALPIFATGSFVLLVLLLVAAGKGYVTNGFVIYGRSVDVFNSTGSTSIPNITLTYDNSGPQLGMHLTSNEQVNNTLYLIRFLPLLFLSTFLGLSKNLDAQFKYLQPLYNMSRRPCSAEDSIILAYLTMSPLEVITAALKRKHSKVCYFSVFNNLSPVLLLVPLNTLTLVYTADGGIIGQFSMSCYIGSTAILCTLIASCVVAWPYGWRKVPVSRHGTSLLDIWALFYRSRLCKLPEFSRCDQDWGPEHLAASIQLGFDKYSLHFDLRDDGMDDAVGFDMCFDGVTGKPTLHSAALPRRSGEDGGPQSGQPGEIEAFELEELQHASPGRHDYWSLHHFSPS